MKVQKEPNVGRVVILFLRILHGGSQRELAAASGVSRSAISRCESGARAVSPTTMGRIAAAAGVENAELEAILRVARAVLQRRRAGIAPGAGRARLVTMESAKAMAGLPDFARGLVAGRPLRHARSQEPSIPAESDRQRAAALWAVIEPYPPDQRRALVEELEELQRWELADFLCDESLKAACEGAARAVELARLALFVAERVAGHSLWQARLEGYAWAHLGNALRVRNELQEADRALDRARSLWRLEGPSGFGLLNEARVFGFESSLRRAQRRFEEAMELLDRALLVDRGDLTAHLLVNKARLLRDLGDLAGAVDFAQRVETLCDLGAEPRLAFIARFNVVDYLSLMGRDREAEAKLPEVKALAERAASELDRLRLEWVQGRIAAGLGRVNEGLAALEEVRRQFAARGLTYDAALAGLELAVLHHRNGDPAAAREIARSTVPAFRQHGIQREALAALMLFGQAGRQRASLGELGWKLVRYLHRARSNPEIRFER